MWWHILVCFICFVCTLLLTYYLLRVSTHEAVQESVRENATRFEEIQARLETTGYDILEI